MKRSFALLLVSSAAAALVAACSAAPDTGGLSNHRTSTGPSAGSTTTGGGDNTGSTGSTTGNGDTGSTGTTPTTPTSNPTSPSAPTQPPPASGPGSTSSAAHQYFNSTVYPAIAVCTGCHATATDGAPKMMEAPADTTYQELDARGLIVSNSLLLTHGTHDTGKAPALTTSQQQVITTWLGMEAQERQGSAAPTNVLADIGKCADETLFDKIGFKNLKTQPKTGENPNRCTGCDNAPCRSCHEGGDQGFFMAEGSNLQPAGTTFHETFLGTQSSTFIVKYFGLNGTAPVASNAILTKMQAVAVAPPYTHPMFVMSQTMQDALNAFVDDAITKYNNHACTGGAADAGTD